MSSPMIHIPGEFETERVTEAIDWTGVPYNIRAQHMGQVSALCTSFADCVNLDRYFGSPDFAPYLPVLVLVPGDDSFKLIVGHGVAPAGELAEIAMEAWANAVDRLKDHNRRAYFDEKRELYGLMRHEDVDAAIRTAFWERARRHKQNPITDPEHASVSRQPNGNVFRMGDRRV